MPRERSVDVGAVTLNLAEGGPGDGPPVLLLHGLGQRWQDLYPIVPPLEQDHRVLAVDLRGHGASGRAPAPSGYRYTDYAADVTALLRQTGTGPVALIGHSLGSLVALGVAAGSPDLVRAVVLLDPPFHSRNTKMVDAAAYPFFQWAEHTARTGGGREALLAACRGMMQGAPEPALEAMADTLAGVDPDAILMVLEDRVLEGYDFEGVLRGTGAPTLIFQADAAAGGALRDADVAWARDLLPDVRLVQVPGAGHSVFRDATEVVLTEIRRFLS